MFFQHLTLGASYKTAKPDDNPHNGQVSRKTSPRPVQTLIQSQIDFLNPHHQRPEGGQYLILQDGDLMGHRNLTVQQVNPGL